MWLTLYVCTCDSSWVSQTHSFNQSFISQFFWTNKIRILNKIKKVLVLTFSLPSATPVALDEFTVGNQARLHSLMSRCCSKFSIDVVLRKFLMFFTPFSLFLSYPPLRWPIRRAFSLADKRFLRLTNNCVSHKSQKAQGNKCCPFHDYY